MQLDEYLKSLTPYRKGLFFARLAQVAGKPYHPVYITQLGGYLRQGILQGTKPARRPSSALAIHIEIASKGAVPCWETRPDIWKPKPAAQSAPPARPAKRKAPPPAAPVREAAEAVT